MLHGPSTFGSAGQQRSAALMSTDANKDLVRRWFAETDRGNDAIVDELCARDYVDHSPPLPGMGPGSAGVRQANAALREAFPDTVHIIEDQIAEADMVVTRLRARATFTGEILGIAPNGKVVEITGISIHRVVDGKLVEHWANADLLGFMQQFGALPTPAGVAH
jgi:predicted ester cyclase